jgi:hypothetical protein
MEMVACPTCGFRDKGKYCSQCAGELRIAARGQRSIKALLGPLYEYVSCALKLARPAKMVSDIKGHRFCAARLITFVLASMAIFNLIIQINPTNELSVIEIPVIGDTLFVILWLIYNVLYYIPLHYILDRKRKAVPFREFFILTGAISALFLPFMSVAFAVGEDLAGVVYLLNLIMFWYIYLQAYAVLYERRVSSLIGVTAIYSVVATLSVGLLLQLTPLS